MSSEKLEQAAVAAGAEADVDPPSMQMSIINEIIYSPINLVLVLIIGFFVYKIIKKRFDVHIAGAPKPLESELPKLSRDFTIQELRQFDGHQPDARELVADNGTVYDVTRGKQFYGPGGPYATFAGRDASRNLATFSAAANDKDEFDDLSGLSAMEMDAVREWEMQFKDEQPTNYEDEEDETAVDNKSIYNTTEKNQRCPSCILLKYETPAGKNKCTCLSCMLAALKKAHIRRLQKKIIESME